MEEKFLCSTAYSESEAMIYDKIRFSDPKERLFNNLEAQQLLNVLKILPPRQKILEIGCLLLGTRDEMFFRPVSDFW